MHLNTHSGKTQKSTFWDLMINKCRLAGWHHTYKYQLSHKSWGISKCFFIDSGTVDIFIKTEATWALYIPVWLKPVLDLAEAIMRALFLRASFHGNCSKGIERPIHSPHFRVVLGISWLALHNSLICWPELTVEFFTEFCPQHCLTPGNGQWALVPWWLHARGSWPGRAIH
ncbi:argininosuccinate lyase [Platysternon megacephalum]|uniref:Argininosuccinate lyase n=1 Tax=Platysternon megacephalum TaxID=55544 RepID=A0A4D9DIV4_9SAUR|nr:argininosuccinate lyase [Platysternon megacephalum]